MEAIQTLPVPPADPLAVTRRLPPKPKLRGVSHHLAFYATPFAAAYLLWHAHGARAALCAWIYSAGMVFLFGASAAFHRPNWSPIAREILGRVDMAGVYIGIATSYVPILLIAVGGKQGYELLAAVSTLALAGVIHAALGSHGSKLIIVVLGSGTGWLGLACAPYLFHSIGAAGMEQLMLGICAVTLGAVIYGFQRPDPWPKVFGYHEIFHALVVFGAGCHYLITLKILSGAQP